MFHSKYGLNPPQSNPMAPTSGYTHIPNQDRNTIPQPTPSYEQGAKSNDIGSQRPSRPNTSCLLQPLILFRL